MNTNKYLYAMSIIAALLGAAPSQAALVSELSGFFTSSNGNGCGYSSFSSTGAIGSALCNAPGTSGVVAARVTEGLIGARAVLSGSPSAFFSGADIRAEATARGEGIIRFDGPAATTNARLSFDLGGLLGNLRPVNEQVVSELIGLTITVAAPFQATGWADSYTLVMYSDGRPDSTALNTGLLLGGYIGQGSYNVVTPAFDMPTGIDLILAIKLTVGTTIFGPGNSFANGSSDFYDTFSFSRTGPAALFVDPGFTLNSADFRVFDNRFGSNVPNPVPEPGTLALLLLGLTAVGVTRRRSPA